MSARHAVLAVAALALSCAPAPPRESQVVIVVRTDAPVPTLFDRLRVEVFPPASDAPCANCASAFDVDRAAVDGGRVSFGVVVRPDVAGYRVRITLHRSLGLAPREESAIRAVRALPVVARGELVTGHVNLEVAATGTPTGTLGAPLPLERGEGAPLAEWPLARERECAATLGPGEACIPGRAFWMGDPRLAIAGLSDEGGRREHLVVVDPFVLDLHEVTVGELRAAGVEDRDALGRIFDPSEDLGPGSACTYRNASHDDDALPVTCVSHVVAARYCERLGKRLPTEAEIELVASHAGERAYVWGFDPPTCGDAIFGRGQGGPCASGSTPLFPTLAGSGARDRAPYRGGEVVDLAGNVSEWAQDRWNRDDESCFPAGIRLNPVCTTVSAHDGLAWVARGGNFRRELLDPAALRTLVETREAQEGVSDQIGFRCARSVLPPAGP